MLLPLTDQQYYTISNISTLSTSTILSTPITSRIYPFPNNAILSSLFASR